MKRIISALLVCVLLVASVFAMASCGKILSGKYSLEVLGVETVAFEFSGNKVSLILLSQEDKAIEGTYKISENDKGETVITLDFDGDKDASKYEGDLPFSDGDDDGVKYIKIAGVKYTKADK